MQEKSSQRRNLFDSKKEVEEEEVGKVCLMRVPAQIIIHRNIAIIAEKVVILKNNDIKEKQIGKGIKIEQYKQRKRYRK